ncbi:MAG: CvpA family protein [Oscillospiraceae bacterium]|nr:CvpA family protein [Oscillospiraceae bacterium]
MAAQLYWFYDALIIGIFLIFLYIGGRRGFLRSVVFLVLVVLSIVVSWLGAEIASPIVYDNFIKEHVTQALTKSSQETSPADIAFEAITEGDYGVEMTDTELDSVLSSAGDFFNNIAQEMKNSGAVSDEEEIKSEVEQSMIEKMLNSLLGDVVSKDLINEMLVSIEGTTNGVDNVLSAFIGGNADETARATEENIVAPIIKGILKILVWLVLMIVFRLIIGPVSDSFKLVNKIPLIGPVNSLLGAILGAVEGIIFIYALSLAVKLAVYLTEGSLMFINDQTISQTYIFRYFYYFDISTLI